MAEKTIAALLIVVHEHLQSTGFSSGGRCGNHEHQFRDAPLTRLKLRVALECEVRGARSPRVGRGRLANSLAHDPVVQRGCSPDGTDDK